jgi:hypothetical protein
MTPPSSFDMPLLSERKFNVSTDPFVYGFVDDFLPTPLYERMESDFPAPDEIPGLQRQGNGKQYRKYWSGEPTGALAKLPEVWRDWIEFLFSDRFLDDCGQWSREFLTTYRKPASNSGLLKLLGDRPGLRHWEVELDCEFSMLPREALLLPHTDSTDKVLTFVLYFPQHDWRDEWGGGTQVYRPLEDRYNTNWSNSRVPRSRTDLVFDSEFRPNRLFFFAKSANSWHGVKPIECPEAVLRRSFNFDFVIPRAQREGTSHRFKERLIRRLETPRFRSLATIEEKR